ncbi:phosphatidylinositol mannoside acyltransferase [Janibacter melonis]|uniref:phosphatidylinositol mannoside acyltransferase n=1 Tax=Janibacter melonis TaxID=262209 RepID=UPI0020433246|nr:phosphatidylinositol mannoside acyltransferase [Janibacter melonis]MCM3554664.1 phosphatidylinositol mannoside acyltransferase [Janibacter melonis]
MPALPRLQERASVLAFRAGWRALRLLPAPLAYALFDAVSAVVTRRDGPSVQRLRSNYARVRPDLGPAELQELTADGVRRAFRYYVEAFRLPALSGEQVDDLVHITGTEPMLAELEQGRPVLAFLGHTGNWDLAGAWCARHLGHVVTVAERLRPEEMFQAFLDFREGELGMTIHPAERGTFGALLAQLRTGDPVVMPLLSDRDLSASGVEVDLAGERARVAAGPAALAVETGVPLFPVTMRHVPRGRHRWGLDITVHPAVDVPAEGTRTQRVAAATQACADALGAAIREHPQDWHMMQRVFVADLSARRRAPDEAAA